MLSSADACSPRDAPHNTPFTYETVPPKGYDNRMAWSGPAQVAANYSTASDYGLATQDDVLRARDGGSTGDFVPGVLHMTR